MYENMSTFSSYSSRKNLRELSHRQEIFIIRNIKDILKQKIFKIKLFQKQEYLHDKII